MEQKLVFYHPPRLTSSSITINSPQPSTPISLAATHAPPELLLLFTSKNDPLVCVNFDPDFVTLIRLLLDAIVVSVNELDIVLFVLASTRSFILVICLYHRKLLTTLVHRQSPNLFTVVYAATWHTCTTYKDQIYQKCCEEVYVESSRCVFKKYKKFSCWKN